MTDKTVRDVMPSYASAELGLDPDMTVTTLKRRLLLGALLDVVAVETHPLNWEQGETQ